MANLPYVASASSLKTAFDKIKTAATPPRVTTDFVNNILSIKGGTGGSVTPFLKRIGFVASDGTPTEIYRRFRLPATAGAAMADAIKFGYKDLAKASEYFYTLSDKDLMALIVQVTGVETDNRAAQMTLACLKVLKQYANFEVEEAQPDPERPAEEPSRQNVALPQIPQQRGRVGLNLSYTINLNLPATSDQAVFNAIFRSLKEHLLSGND